jgi:hypothetical protein
MTMITVSADRFRIHLARWERVAGLVRDLDVPLSAVRSVEVAPDGLAAARGLRAPGLGIPGRRKIGTWRWRGHKSWVAVRRGEPALVIELDGVRFDRIVVGCPQAQRYAEELRAHAATLRPGLG